MMTPIEAALAYAQMIEAFNRQNYPLAHELSAKLLSAYRAEDNSARLLGLKRLAKIIAIESFSAKQISVPSTLEKK